MFHVKHQAGFIQGPTLYLVIGLATALVLSWAGSGLAIWYLDRQVETARQDAQDARDALAKEQASRKTFEAAAGACSAGVDKLKAEADRKEKEHAASQAKSNQATTLALNTIQKILTAPRPPGMDECQAMKKELDDEIDRRHPRK